MNEGLHPHLTPQQINAMSALALAHIGDAVFELLVRTQLCTAGYTRNGNLHRETVERVCAPAQAALTEKLLPLLTPEELAIFRRGRNAHVHGIPKNATHAQYSRATGLEALFGALYLSGAQARAEELFAALTEEASHAI